MKLASAWTRRWHWPPLQARRVQAVFHGLYCEKPLSSAVHTLASPDQRVVHVPKRLGFGSTRTD
jgi:hypothetical protein